MRFGSAGPDANRRAEKRRREEELARRKQGVSFRQADPVDRFDFSADMSEFFDDE